MNCPCHSGESYLNCCAPYHEGKITPNAVALMRSRYSAYALNKSDYIIATTHPDHSDSSVPLKKRKQQISDFSKNTTFQGLDILEFVEALPYSTVTFRAILIQKGQDVSFTEKSEFAQINGRWLYRRALSMKEGKNCCRD